MKIDFSKVVPIPIPERDVENSEIWNKNLKLDTNENLMIYADSGKGKTTFINIIYGIRKDYSGTVCLDGKNINNLSNKKISEIRKTKISIVPQGLMLFSDLTVRENILIKNKITNFKTESEILEMIDYLGLKDFFNKKVEKMSYGQQQRIAIVRALCQPFQLILLDEIFSHIDNNNIQKAWDLISLETKKQNAGIILTSLFENTNFEINKLRV
ncbi:MAG: ATP-binding cassette domain-containing protein [Bacteroidales bacterium]|jgi:ABC-type lipoprotein export system ATPase subunit|nr:ATP-binding cassette domain-containing protein [Bacteroidales bacterium]